MRSFRFWRRDEQDDSAPDITTTGVTTPDITTTDTATPDAATPDAAIPDLVPPKEAPPAPSDLAEPASPVERAAEPETAVPPAPAPPPVPEPEARRGWFDRLRAGLSKSSERLSQGINTIFLRRRLDQAALDELEELLIASDMGIGVAGEVVEHLRRNRFNRRSRPRKSAAPWPSRWYG